METLHEEALAAAGKRADGTIDINAAMRSMLEGLLNAVMDEQASELGAARNGYRERSLDTCIGTVTLRIPKLREGTYFPDDVVPRWSRTDTALASAISDMWVAGVSTRKIERAAADLGVESMSRSRVSRLCASLDEEVEELRRGDLSAEEWPYLWVDATYVPCREAGAPRSVALVTAVACSRSARRRVVGVESVDTESYLSWRGFLLSLRERGLSGVELVTSDAHSGLVRAVRECFPGAAWQRCVAHLERNAADACRRRRDGAAACAALKAAFAERDPALVRAGYRRAAEVLSEADARAGGLLEDAGPNALAYLAFPREHALWLRTNNIQERMNGEIKRRTRVVQVFPSTASLVRLVGAVCCDQNDAWAAERNFIDPRTLRPGYEREPLPEEPGGEERVRRAVEEAFDRKARTA